jgi:hypothetical protein
VTLAELKERRARLQRLGAYVDVRATGERLYLRLDVPRTRQDCPTTRPCPHVRCRDHLWRDDADDRAGNPEIGEGPQTTLSVSAPWISKKLAASCAIDSFDMGGMSVQDIAKAMQMHRGNVWLIWRRKHVQEAFEELRELLQGEGE